MSSRTLKPRIVYLANVRLPTEKAHGYQICKMCEAFTLNGAEIHLFHPYRRQVDPHLKGQGVFDYYGIQPIFEIHTVKNLDVVPLSRVVPQPLFRLMFFIHAFIWAYYATWVARGYKGDFYYTREATIAFWLTRMGLPTVYEVHVVPERVQKWLLKRFARHSALRLVVVLTSFIRDRLLDMGFPPEKIVVWPDAVDLGMFDPLPSKEECRRQLGLPLERPIIGYIGRFRTMGMEKGIPELIHAVKALPSINRVAPLFLAVGGPMESVPVYLDLARRIGVSLDKLRFVDRVPNAEVPCWIKTFDVAVAPFPQTDHYAYFMSPLKLFEYMATGVPIVATELPSVREILHHGRNAWLVPPENPNALAEGIYHILKNPDLARRLARQAQEDVRRYTWKRRAASILQHVLGRV